MASTVGASVKYPYPSTDRREIVWVENGGIVGRGVLLDYLAWAEANGKPVDCFQSQSIPVSSLQEVAASQNTSFRPGDILFVRTGWTRAYERLTQAECQQLADCPAPQVIGVESSEATLRWIWDNNFAAVVGDMPAFEAYPCQNLEFFLHQWLLAGWGVPIGELFDLERLSQECRKRGRWSFFFSSVPLKVSIDASPVPSSPMTDCPTHRCLGGLPVLPTALPFSEPRRLIVCHFDRSDSNAITMDVKQDRVLSSHEVPLDQ